MFGKYWGANVFFKNFAQPCTTACALGLTSMVGVCGFDEFYDLHGCEIVGWVSKKSGCLWFPGKMMSINLSEHT